MKTTTITKPMGFNPRIALMNFFPSIKNSLALRALAVMLLASLGPSPQAWGDDSDFVEFSGQVIDQQMQPVSGVFVRSMAYNVVDETKTDAEGKFTVRVTQKRLPQINVVADDATGKRMGFYFAKHDDPPQTDKPITIQLQPCRELPVELLDAAGNPCGEAIVGAMIQHAPVATAVTDAEGHAILRWPVDAKPSELYACKPDVGFDYRIITSRSDNAHDASWLERPPVRLQLAPAQTLRIRMVDRQDKPISGVRVYPFVLHKAGEPDSFNLSYVPWLFTDNTDRDGIATFPGIPTWDRYPLTFFPSPDKLVRKVIEFDPQQHPDGMKTVVLDRFVPVRGQVKFADGKPAPGVGVRGVGTNYAHDYISETAITDDEGKFTLQLAPDRLYAFAVEDKKWRSRLLDGFVLKPDTPLDGLLLTARPATHLKGRITQGPDNSPVANQWVQIAREGRSVRELGGTDLPNPNNETYHLAPSISQNATTDDEGNFELFLGPGQYHINGVHIAQREFNVLGQSEFPLHLHLPPLDTGPVAGTVVTGQDSTPVAKAIVSVYYRDPLGALDVRFRADDNGHFSGERRRHRAVWHAISDDGKLAGILETGPDDEEITIPIAPVASVTGRLIDRNTKVPITRRKIRWGRVVHHGDDDAPYQEYWGGTTETDDDGRFTATGLVVGQEYSFLFAYKERSYLWLPAFTPHESGENDMGDVSELERR